jgi:hypothetical protein
VTRSETHTPGHGNFMLRFSSSKMGTTRDVFGDTHVFDVFDVFDVFAGF